MGQKVFEKQPANRNDLDLVFFKSGHIHAVLNFALIELLNLADGVHVGHVFVKGCEVLFSEEVR